jgi:hypothetical protein
MHMGRTFFVPPEVAAQAPPSPPPPPPSHTPPHTHTHHPAFATFLVMPQVNLCVHLFGMSRCMFK